MWSTHRTLQSTFLCGPLTVLSNQPSWVVHSLYSPINLPVWSTHRTLQSTFLCGPLTVLSNQPSCVVHSPYSPIGLCGPLSTHRTRQSAGPCGPLSTHRTRQSAGPCGSLSTHRTRQSARVVHSVLTVLANRPARVVHRGAVLRVDVDLLRVERARLELGDVLATVDLVPRPRRDAAYPRVILLRAELLEGVAAPDGAVDRRRRVHCRQHRGSEIRDNYI